MKKKYIAKHRSRPVLKAADLRVGLNAIVVIPAFNEPEVLITLQSLENCESPQKPVEIIVVFNHPENASSEIKKKNLFYYKEAIDFTKKNELKFDYLIIDAFDLPAKDAGVGLARKIGMDKAVNHLGNNNDGLIICLDADCTVAPNYLVEIEKHFDQNKKSPGASVYFEHLLDTGDKELNNGIIQYELHLRYYNQLLRYTGHPFAFHTVGSSMVVRSGAYQKQGGMNKRKAGEDFYFLQKMIQLGDFTEINKTCVYPSSRISERVPFGTGKAQGDWINQKKKQLLTYHPEAGMVLKSLFDIVYQQGKRLSVFSINDLPVAVIRFFGVDQWNRRITEIDKNTSTDTAFIKRFFTWFNLFVAMRFVHFYRDNFKKNIPVIAASKTFSKTFDQSLMSLDPEEILQKYREIERRDCPAFGCFPSKKD